MSKREPQWDAAQARSVAISAERGLRPKNLSSRFSGDISSYNPCSCSWSAAAAGRMHTVVPSASRAWTGGALVVWSVIAVRSEEHTSELQSRPHIVCRLLLEKKNSTKHKSPHLSGWRQIISLIT